MSSVRTTKTDNFHLTLVAFPKVFDKRYHTELQNQSCTTQNQENRSKTSKIKRKTNTRNAMTKQFTLTRDQILTSINNAEWWLDRSRICSRLAATLNSRTE